MDPDGQCRTFQLNFLEGHVRCRFAIEVDHNHRWLVLPVLGGVLGFFEALPGKGLVVGEDVNLLVVGVG
jgi:hypothetical protein